MQVSRVFIAFFLLLTAVNLPGFAAINRLNNNGRYDQNYLSINNPVMSYASYLGGASADYIIDSATDRFGNLYLAGVTFSHNFPITSGALQPERNDQFETAFITKIDPTGEVIFSTYFAGVKRFDYFAIDTDLFGNLIIVGQTNSPSFPITPGAYQRKLNNKDSNTFVTKLSATGDRIIFSTFLDQYPVRAMAVDLAGNILLTGDIGNYLKPTKGVVQKKYGGETDAYLLKLNSSGSKIIFKTFLGGKDFDVAFAVATDNDGNIYLGGNTRSPDFPTTSSSIDDNRQGGKIDVFVTKLDPLGLELLYSTTLGSDREDESLADLAVDQDGMVYLTGSCGNLFPTTAGALQQYPVGIYGGAFVSKIDPTNNALIYSTFLNGGDYEQPNAIAVDYAGNATIVGRTSSQDFPVTADAILTTCPQCQINKPEVYGGFISTLNNRGEQLLYSSYLSGNNRYEVAVDLFGNIYPSGFTNAGDLPVIGLAYQQTNAGNGDGFFMKLIQYPQQESLKITAATIENKTLIINGDNFSADAEIILNGVAIPTTTNSDNNGLVLSANQKINKLIPYGTTVLLQIREPNGLMTPGFIYTRPTKNSSIQ